MRQFTDTKERVWDVELNVRQMKRVRDALGIDLVNVIQAGKDGAVATDTLDRVANDPILLVDILWVLCEGQAKAAGVTDDDFGSSLAGDSISDATRAFLDELVDFFPGARRLFLKKAVDLARKYETENLEVLEKALASPEFEERLKTSLIPPAASRESAESTPAPSP
ncbi:MAG: hypothetical protein IJQ34_00590 [Kiritimatiellae bacterium]|nr:hypothetical protein [Kiritimatiellia bacterium]